MRELTIDEVAMVSGQGAGEAMDGKCWAGMGLNYLITGGAIAGAILATGGLGAIVAVGGLAGAASSWGSWWEECASPKTQPK